MQTWYTDGVQNLYHRQAPLPPMSKVKVARSRHPPDRYDVRRIFSHKLRTKRSRNTKIARKVAHPTGNNAHQFQGQRSRSSRRLMLRSEVHHIFRTERSTNLVCRWRTKTCITNKRHDLQGQRSKSRCHMVRLTGVNP